MNDVDHEAMGRAAFDAGAFTCPRCGTVVADEYYGPCASCRVQLRSVFTAEQRVVAETEYEPKMNVTPNAVALKD